MAYQVRSWNHALASPSHERRWVWLDCVESSPLDFDCAAASRQLPTTRSARGTRTFSRSNPPNVACWFSALAVGFRSLSAACCARERARTNVFSLVVLFEKNSAAPPLTVRQHACGSDPKAPAGRQLSDGIDWSFLWRTQRWACLVNVPLVVCSSLYIPHLSMRRLPVFSIFKLFFSLTPASHAVGDADCCCDLFS